jgi:hypothetical protein
MPSEMSEVFEVLELSGAVSLAAVPPQALNDNRMARPAAAVWTLLMVFMVLPFEWLQLNLVR